MFGFIGPNGAGKTTTMRILATLLNPTWGEAYVGGYSIYTKPKEDSTNRRLHARLLRRVRRHEGDRVPGVLRGRVPHSRAEAQAGVRRVLDLVELGYKRQALVTSLSRVDEQRLGLARVPLHDPQVLLLDEPASGLDPRAASRFAACSSSLRTGKTIMVSSHILPESADVCNKIGIIEKGELIVNDSVVEVLKKVRGQTKLDVAIVGDQSAAAKLLEQSSMVDHVQVDETCLTVALKNGEHDYSELATALVKAGHKLKLFREHEIDLETAFMALTKGITS